MFAFCTCCGSDNIVKKTRVDIEETKEFVEDESVVVEEPGAVESKQEKKKKQKKKKKKSEKPQKKESPRIPEPVFLLDATLDTPKSIAEEDEIEDKGIPQKDEIAPALVAVSDVAPPAVDYEMTGESENCEETGAAVEEGPAVVKESLTLVVKSPTVATEAPIVAPRASITPSFGSSLALENLRKGFSLKKVNPMNTRKIVLWINADGDSLHWGTKRNQGDKKLLLKDVKSVVDSGIRDSEEQEDAGGETRKAQSMPELMFSDDETDGSKSDSTSPKSPRATREFSIVTTTKTHVFRTKTSKEKSEIVKAVQSAMTRFTLSQESLSP